LGGAESGIFLQTGLDSPNQLEKSQQIALWAHGHVARLTLRSAPRQAALPRQKVTKAHNRENLKTRKEEMSKPKKVTASSGNVFADLGFDNPEEELLKAKLVREIRGIFKRRKLTQTKAAAMLGLKQPDVSALVTGRVGKFSIDRLIRCLDRMDYKVDVVVRHKPRRASSRAIAA
jgi:predicted XRE-type DNA-binding protein